MLGGTFHTRIVFYSIHVISILNFSSVVALTFIWSSEIFKAFAILIRISSIYGDIFGDCAITVLSMLEITYPLLNSSSDTLDKSIILDVVDQFKKLGLYEITISGGEPLVHPDFVEILQEINKRRLHINLFTNASLLNQKLIDILNEVNVKDVQFSLYGLDYNTFSRVTGTNNLGLFNDYICGIELLSQSSLNVTCAMVIMKGNFHQRHEMLEMCLKNNFNMRSSYRLISTRTSQDVTEFDLDSREKKQLMSEIIAYNKMKQEENRKTYLLENESPKRNIMNGMCTAGSTSFCLSATGDILPCPGYYFAIGNVYNSKIVDILNSPNALKIKNSSRKDYTKCSECSYFDFCAFCPGIIHNEGLSRNFDSCSICSESKLFSLLINQ